MTIHPEVPTPHDPELAYCIYCRKPTQLLSTLPYLEWSEQRAAKSCAVCRFAPDAHAPEVRVRPHLRYAMGDGHAFTPRDPADVPNVYYCGCRGWD